MYYVRLVLCALLGHKYLFHEHYGEIYRCCTRCESCKVMRCQHCVIAAKMINELRDTLYSR